MQSFAYNSDRKVYCLVSPLTHFSRFPMPCHLDICEALNCRVRKKHGGRQNQCGNKHKINQLILNCAFIQPTIYMEADC